MLVSSPRSDGRCKHVGPAANQNLTALADLGNDFCRGSDFKAWASSTEYSVQNSVTGLDAVNTRQLL